MKPNLDETLLSIDKLADVCHQAVTQHGLNNILIHKQNVPDDEFCEYEATGIFKKKCGEDGFCWLLYKPTNTVTVIVSKGENHD